MSFDALLAGSERRVCCVGTERCAAVLMLLLAEVV